MKDNSTVCQNAIEALFLIKQLKSRNVTEQDDLMLTELSSRVRTMRKKAQRMEKRLEQYRYAIERLGFERVRPGDAFYD